MLDSFADSLSPTQWSTMTYSILWSIGFLSAVAALLRQTSIVDGRSTRILAILLCILAWLLLGQTPVGFGTENDRENYVRVFLNIKENTNIQDTESYEWLFIYYNQLVGKFFGYEGFLSLTALIYSLNYTIAAIRLSEKNSYWILLCAILSFGFISYNVNTLRSGMAISFLVLGVGMYPSLWKMLVCFFVATGIHTSTIIPAILIVVCYFFNKPKICLIIWLLAIPISFLSGDLFNFLFAGWFDDERTSYLTTESAFYRAGFRIDFILYSALAVVLGYFYIYRCNFKDRFYTTIYSSYLLTNVFWILVIRASFSDRFAYLSWFLFPFILIYPLLKKEMFPILKQNLWVALILLGEIAFSYIF